MERCGSFRSGYFRQTEQRNLSNVINELLGGKNTSPARPTKNTTDFKGGLTVNTVIFPSGFLWLARWTHCTTTPHRLIDRQQTLTVYWTSSTRCCRILRQKVNTISLAGTQIA